MITLKRPAGKRKVSPRPNEAAFIAVCNLLITGRSTREENRMAVRHLLRQASRDLERNRDPQGPVPR